MTTLEESTVNSTIGAAVYRADGIRIYGLDAELEIKAQSKRDQQFEQAVGKWIEDVLKEKLEFPNDIMESLKSGVILCKLINAIQPGTIKRINTKNVALMQVENITVYLKCCWKLGVPSADLFVTSDLFQRKGVNQVFQNISSLSRVAQTMPSFKGPKLGAKLAAPPATKKWGTVEVNQPVYVEDLERKKRAHQSSSELKQLKATIEAAKAEKEELWHLKTSLEDRLSEQEAELEVHTHKIQQYENHTQKLQERLEEMEKFSKEMEETLSQQTRKIIVQESQNMKLKIEKEKFSEEVQRVFQEKVKVFQDSLLLKEEKDKMAEEKKALLKEHLVVVEERVKAIEEEERAQMELTKAKLSHIEELSSLQEHLQELRRQISEQRQIVLEEKNLQQTQAQEKERLQEELERISADLVQKAVELSEAKQTFAISKEEYEDRLLTHKMVSNKELEDKIEEQATLLARQKVFNKLLQANIEKMTSDKDAIAQSLEAVRQEKLQLEKEKLENLIEKERQNEEKMELTLVNQKLSLEIQEAKLAVREISDGHQRDADDRLAEANSKIAELQAALRVQEDEKRVILAEKFEISLRSHEMAKERLLLHSRVDELESQELLAKRDLEVAALEKATREAKTTQMAATIENLNQENEHLVKELITLKHVCRNLKNKSQLEKTKADEEIAIWKKRHEEEIVKRKSIKQAALNRKRATAELPVERPPSVKPPNMETLDKGGEDVRNLSFRKSGRYQAFTQSTVKKLMTSESTENKDISRLSTLLTSDAGRRRFTINLQSSFKETPQQILDNMSFDTMLELFNKMLSEMDFNTNKDFISAKVLMQTSTRMSRRMPGDKMQYMQDLIKKHEVWKNTKFWEEYFWEELAKRHRKKYGTEVDHVDNELVAVLLGGFCYNMLSWGVTLEDGKKFALDMAQRNGLTPEQIDKLLESISAFSKEKKDNTAIIASAPVAENFWNILQYQRPSVRTRNGSLIGAQAREMRPRSGKLEPLRDNPMEKKD